LLEAVRGALTGLSGAEATPAAIEAWIKTNRYAVWSSLTLPSTLKEAIEVARQERGARPESPAKGTGARGRKKSDRGKPAAPPTAVPEPAGAARTDQGAGPGKDQESLAEVVRKAFAGVGPEADNEAVRGWIARNYPGREFNPGTLNNTISAQRSRLKREGSVASVEALSTPRQSATPGYDPTRSELLRVLEIARQQGGVSKLGKLVQAVKQLADQVGGLDRLAVCLDALEELGVK
jgi:hypothetical protein